MRRLHEIAPDRLAAIALVATDIDGTMTRDGKLDPRVLDACARLAAAGVTVLPVTGRPAGEALGLARYLPGVTRAIAENGGTFLQPDEPLELLRPAPDRQGLLAAADRLGQQGRPWQLAPDHFCRVADLAWLREGRSDAELAALAQAAAAMGLQMIWSNVHLHLSEVVPDKGAAVLEIGRRLGIAPHAVATIGDAPNDAGLWTPGRFGLPVGTAQVAEQLAVLPWTPEVLVAEASEGWLELAEALLRVR
jgi:hydroxymethylpyrimidine pyrophosphatase-like HAD family hydrolase